MWQIKLQLSPWAWLVIGVAIGWIVEWLIDWLFWRRRYEQRSARLQSEVDTWRYRIHNFENAADKARAELDSTRAASADLARKYGSLEQDYSGLRNDCEALRGECEELRNRPAGDAASSDEIEAARAALEAAHRELTSLREQATSFEHPNAELDLARAEGESLRRQLAEIGSAGAELAQARAQLQALRYELTDLREAGGSIEAARTELQDIVQQLQESRQTLVESERLRRELAEAQAALEARRHVEDDFEGIKVEHASMKSALESARAEVDRLKADGGEGHAAQAKALQKEADGERRSRAALEERYAELHAQYDGLKLKLDTLQSAAAPASTVEGDPLHLIRGIGRSYARRLNGAGVRTFLQLAGLSPQAIRDILKPKDWQKIEPERWIAEAAKRAAGAVGVPR